MAFLNFQGAKIRRKDGLLKSSVSRAESAGRSDGADLKSCQIRWQEYSWHGLQMRQPPPEPCALSPERINIQKFRIQN
jgi:hypothetical protein